MKGAALACLILCGTAAAAQVAATDPGLPPEPLVQQAIEATPEVRAAQAAVDRAAGEQGVRRAGPHEAQLTVIPQRRHVDGSGRYSEWEVDLSRGVRWPGKARLDREIGASGVEAARLMLEDAHHAMARRLLALWSDWRRAAAALEVQQRQVQLWQRERDAVARRERLGDAAQRDLVAVEAASAQAQAATLQARADLTAARLALASAFPGLPLPEQAHLPASPAPLPGAAADWVDRIVARSHEIGAAEARVREKSAEARRARADRMPDPIVGFRVLNEQGGRERAVGLTLSFPIGAARRAASARVEGANASGARADLTMVRRDVREGAELAVAAAGARIEVWQRQREARDAAETSAAKYDRAYALGESGLAEVLAARRTAQDAALAERRALVDAIESVARVEVDAHELWHRVDDGPADAHAHEGAATPLP